VTSQETKISSRDGFAQGSIAIIVQLIQQSIDDQ